MSYLFKVLELFLTYQDLHHHKSSEWISLSRSYRKQR